MTSLTRQDQDSTRGTAATTIQRAWRKKNNDIGLNSDRRWGEVAASTQLTLNRLAAERGENTAKRRWTRAGRLTGKLQGSNVLQGSEILGDSSTMKILETQHWLEMIDVKHRYGSNLKFYHRRWQKEDTEENFFKWLDRGSGKDLSLEECSREKLESERIEYLSAEQRLNYQVKIDEKGKLRWSSSNELVDTTTGHWKDAGGGKGIVRAETTDEQPTLHRRSSFLSQGSLPPSPSPLGSDNEKQSKEGNSLTQAMMKKLLKRQVRKNTWIYVSDKHLNLFIGIKVTGSFQHSSFLSGGLVTSAGLISVKHGLIHTLSPLSGHYRTTPEHFNAFVRSLRARGVDMSHAKIRTALLSLWFVARLKRIQKSKRATVQASKEHVQEVQAKVKNVIALENNDLSNWKREVLQGRKKQPAEGHQDTVSEREEPSEAKGQGLAEMVQGEDPVALST